MPNILKEANETFFFEEEDKIITMMRYFNWDISKAQDKWFGMDQDQVFIDVGITFDQKLKDSHKDIMVSHKDQNGGLCSTCYCEFEQDDQADQLICGHQYHEGCWKMYLENEVTTAGPFCVTSKCQQLNCNVSIPFSFFKKHL